MVRSKRIKDDTKHIDGNLLNTTIAWKNSPPKKRYGKTNVTNNNNFEKIIMNRQISRGKTKRSKSCSDDDTNTSYIKVNNKLPKKRTRADSGISLSTKDSIDSLSPSSSHVVSIKNTTNNCINKKPKKKYICATCNKQFLGSGDLKRHILIHSDERPYPCDKCDKKFRQAGCLKNHIASIHGSDEKFSCQICNKSFPLKERLRLHLRLHSGEKPYSCEICSKSFARSGQLKQHSISHQKVVNYNCEICNSSFLSILHLQRHLKFHQTKKDFTCYACKDIFSNVTDLRKHLMSKHADIKALHCKICDKTFKGHIKQHMRTHINVREFNCGICKATFSQKSQLNVHIRMHSGERPYQCKICWQTFAHSSVLKLHIRKHTGEKPFKCILCKENESAFSQLSHLKNHMKVIHEQDKSYFCNGCEKFYKTKNDLQIHQDSCLKLESNLSNNVNNDNSKDEENILLSKLRFLITVLIKRISSEDKLKQLGFEKRLIDNLVIDSLKLAGRAYHCNKDHSELELLKMNIEEFLEWTVPAEALKRLRDLKSSIPDILEDVVNVYSKEKN